MSKLKKLFYLTVSLGVLSIAVTITYIVLAVTDIIDTRSFRLDILFAILTPTVFFALALSFAYYYGLKQSLKQLENENLYNLGTKNTFFNSYFFFPAVTKLLKSRKYKNTQPYMLAFTATGRMIARNTIKNDVITSYTSYIAQYMADKFTYNAQKNAPYAYCFYHGAFLLMSFGDDTEIENLVNEIENAMYQIANDNQLNIYVQPFFGVTKMNRSEQSLVAFVEQALAARNVAEKRYETLSYFDNTKGNNSLLNDVEEIKLGLENNEFVVYYQPKYSLNSNTFISTEALIRWNSSKFGLLPPSKFIEAAENSGLIHQLDDYVLERVCSDIKENRIKGRRNLPVSVNFSMQEFYDTNFIDETIEICEKYGVSPSMIQIEVTESTSQMNAFMSTAIINKLKGLGFRILMDDFGTGFSNIENLMLLPFDAVKLDRSYIERIVSDPKSKELVKFLINLCKISHMEVIAEGVDNPSQVAALKRLGCDTIQGYYYSKPLPKADLDAFLLPNGNNFEKKKKEALEE